jgi:hypothetical protein
MSSCRRAPVKGLWPSLSRASPRAARQARSGLSGSAFTSRPVAARSRGGTPLRGVGESSHTTGGARHTYSRAASAGVPRSSQPGVRRSSYTRSSTRMVARPRARGAGRPAARRRSTSRSTRAGPSDDDREPEPPRRRPLGPRYEWRVWAERRSRALDALVRTDQLAHEREQLAFDVEAAA